MNRHELQYIADTLLIEKVVLMDTVISKQADILSSLSSGLGSLAQHIKNEVLNNIDTSSPYAFGTSILGLLTPGILFRINPVLGGALIFAAQLFNFNFDSIFKTILDPVRAKISKGEQVSPQELDSAAASLLEGAVTASYDFFADLRAIEKNGLLKSAQMFGSSSPGGAMMFPAKGTPMLHRIFGMLGRGKSKGLVVGFVLWFIKTVLASALLLGTGSAISEYLHKDEKQPGAAMEKQPIVPAPISPGTPTLPKQRHNLQSSGRGEKFNKNDDVNMWIVPLYGGVKNTLIIWALDSYPELQGHENLIRTSPSFNRVSNLMEEYVDSRSPNYLIMPKGINRIIDVVDSFVGEVAAKIPQRVQNEI